MNIQTIATHSYNKIRHNPQQKLNNKTQIETITTPPAKKVNYLHFAGLNQIANTKKAFAEYRWFIDSDKLPAINSLLKIETTKENFEALTRRILQNEALSFELIDSIVRQPRNIKHFVKAFDAKLPLGNDIFLSYGSPSVYETAYRQYIDTRLKNATSISELLQIRPDWRGDVLLKKHQEIYHNNDFELGRVPEEINHGKFEQIIEYLKPYMDSGFKERKEVPPLHIDGKTFNFHFFTDGKSDKNVFAICDNFGNKFVIKIAPQDRCDLDAPFAMGTLCKIDTYLTRNYCRNSAPLRYYNHKMNTSIYDFIEHRRIEGIKPSTSEIHRNIPDFIDLGMKYNDTVGHNNLFILDETQHRVKGLYDFGYGTSKREWISVDNDHVTYDTKLQPKIPEYHLYLPNEMQMFF